jgi:hypothetical protein
VVSLLAAGADVHVGGDTPLRLAAARCPVGGSGASAATPAGLGSDTPRTSASASPAHVAVMAALLSAGADVHAKVDEALSLAVERGWVSG